MYDIPIYLIVQSKYPEMLASFKETFLPTTKNFKKLTLIVEDKEEYGAKIINQHINKARDLKQVYFGVFNDDIVFTDGWLESVLPFFNQHWVVSAGYVETASKVVLDKAVELTKNETGFVKHLYGPNAIFNMNLFRKIGVFDERYDWTCDDLDWALRLKLNNMSSITLKRITMGHSHGQTRKTSIKNWHTISTVNKQRFYQKNGYEAYRFIRSEYKFWHQYFVQFK